MDLPGDGAVQHGRRGPLQVHAAVLASELRRRRVGAPAVVSALYAVNSSTYVLGDVRETPTSLLVLAAFSLTSGRSAPRG